MYRKNCERCKRPSYSSSELGEWKCPTCGHDLTNHPHFDAITLEQAINNKNGGQGRKPLLLSGGRRKKTVQQLI